MKTIAVGALACILALGMTGSVLAQSSDASGTGTDAQMNGGTTADSGSMMKKPMKHHMAKKPVKHHAMKKPMKSMGTM